MKSCFTFLFILYLFLFKSATEELSRCELFLFVEIKLVCCLDCHLQDGQDVKMDLYSNSQLS